VNKRAEDMTSKLPYSTPGVFPYSRSDLANRFRNRDAEKSQPVENRFVGQGIHPPPLLIEGFDGEVRDLVQVLSSIGSSSHSGTGPADERTESVPDRGGAPAEDGICILLVDMRRRNSVSGQPLTRIESDPISNATLVLILADSGQDFMVGSEIRHTDRWHFSGAITPAGIGGLVQSVRNIWTSGIEPPAESSSTVKVSGSGASAVAYAGRE
jgi:hypothetical protein